MVVRNSPMHAMARIINSALFGRTVAYENTPLTERKGVFTYSLRSTLAISDCIFSAPSSNFLTAFSKYSETNNRVQLEENFRNGSPENPLRVQQNFWPFSWKLRHAKIDQCEAFHRRPTLELKRGTVNLSNLQWSAQPWYRNWGE